MPEYPDIELYLHSLKPRVLNQALEAIQQKDPFVLRTVQPPLKELVGSKVVSLRRLGKRIVLEFEGERFLIIHLMIAGRFRWNPKKSPTGLLSLTFQNGTLSLTEAGTKRRAKVHVVEGAEALKAHDPGGLEIFDSSLEEFSQQLTSRRHTLKRALTDPTMFSGIGNAYSDEILLSAKLSPVRQTTQLGTDEIARLFESCQSILRNWKAALIAEWGEKFPTTVTAFHPKMGAHGRYLSPCPQCSNPIQRICYSSNETNYCAHCQTEERILSDRSLAKLLKADWPRTLEELEEKMATSRS